MLYSRRIYGITFACVGIKIKHEISRVSFQGGARRSGTYIRARRDVSIPMAFSSRKFVFPGFLRTYANWDTWSRPDYSQGLFGNGRQEEDGKRLASGASLVTRNSTRAFLEFPSSTGNLCAGDTNFARTFPWKRPTSRRRRDGGRVALGRARKKRAKSRRRAGEMADGGISLKSVAGCRRVSVKWLPIGHSISISLSVPVVRNIAASAERELPLLSKIDVFESRAPRGKGLLARQINRRFAE